MFSSKILSHVVENLSLVVVENLSHVVVENLSHVVVEQRRTWIINVEQRRTWIVNVELVNPGSHISRKSCYAKQYERIAKV